MELGIIPFWFWNGELEEKELEWQMREYKSKGIQGLFIHGRFGLKVPYLSKDWFERVKYVVGKAKNIGLDIWIYDEMNWPSGTAERQVLKKYPHLSQKYLEMVVLNVYGPLFTFLEASDDRYINTGNAKPIAAYACAMDEFDTGIKDIIDLTPNLSFDKVIPWEAPSGKWKLLYFLEKEADYYIDALNPESTERFLELTHEQYKSAVGKDFGKTVPGFYTDEPAMHYYHVGMDNFIIPWSAKMFKIFRERRGYDLKPFLPALYASMGERTAQIRYDFWLTLTEQYADSYYKRIRDWCDEHGVLFTGHLLGEDRLRMHARCEGNIFKHLKHMHITGVDHLYPVIGTQNTPDEHVALKLASSAAHHFGSARLLCESMGGTYWDCTLERMKWIANWEYVLGVTIFNNHGYHYSIEGERKRDWPPSQFYHHTWWKYYDQFTTYMARLGHILSGGRHVAKLLMLYPIDSIWANYVPQKRDDISALTENDFNYLTDALLRLHFDFDYTDEDILCDAEVDNGRIRIRDESYELLILPPITHIKEATFKKIEQFVESGGYLIADALLPLAFLNAPGDGAVERVKKLFGADPLKLLQDFQNSTSPEMLHKSETGRVFVFTGHGISTSRDTDGLRKAIESCIVPDVTIDNEHVFYLHRNKDGFDIYFLVNTLQQDQGEVEITFSQSGVPELWDPVTGEIGPVHTYRIENDRLHLSLYFPPTGSHIILLRAGENRSHACAGNLVVESITDNRIAGYASAAEGTVHVKLNSPKGIFDLKQPARKSLPDISLDEVFDFHIEDHNVLCINHWKMKIGEKTDKEDFIISAEFDDSHWLDVTMGAWEMQLPFERDQAIYPVNLWYRTGFKTDFIPDYTGLMIDGFSGSSHRLFINGRAVMDSGRRSDLDAEIREVDISNLVKKGKNSVAVMLVVEKRTDGILDLLKIRGDFAVSKQTITAPVKCLKTGSWTGQGMPYYSGTGVYEAKFELPEEYLAGKLYLEVDCGEDVLEFSINDSAGRIIPWHPYQADITDLVKKGKNTITLKVTNTLINLLEAVEKPSGIFTPPVIKHLHRYVFSI